MIIDFSTLAEMAVDLEADSKRVMDKVVRVSSATETREGGGVTDVHIVATYVVGGTLYQLKEHCGEDVLGGEAKGSDRAAVIVNRVKALCDEYGLTLRGGVCTF